MSAPALNLLTLSSLGAAFVASLAGSLHCVGMCGPLRLLCGQGKGARSAYQAGRGFAYLLLGFMAGALGAALPLWILLPFLAAGILVSLLDPKILPSAWHQKKIKIYALASANPLFLGLISGILPCGLLHAWVAAAAATLSPWRGGALLFTLWLGTLPALELGPGILGKSIANLRRRFPKAVPAFFLILALTPISLRAYHGLKNNSGTNAPSAHHSCH